MAVTQSGLDDCSLLFVYNQAVVLSISIFVTCSDLIFVVFFKALTINYNSQKLQLGFLSMQGNITELNW